MGNPQKMFRALLLVCVLYICLADVHSHPVKQVNQHRYFGRRWGSPPSPPAPATPVTPTPAPTPATLYVDGASGTWGVGTVYNPVSATVGESVVFKYSANHNVYSMPTQAAFDGCDFTGATELGSTSQGGGAGALPNQYSYKCASEGDVYIACQVGSHCSSGQKVKITCGVEAINSVTHASST